MTNVRSAGSSLKKLESSEARHEATPQTPATSARSSAAPKSGRLAPAAPRPTMIGAPLWTRRMDATTPFLVLLLLLLPTNQASSIRSGRCSDSLQRILKLTRLTQKESTELIQTYKASQGDMSDVFCRASLHDVPEPAISGLKVSERLESVLDRLCAFLPHLRRVYDQQADLQAPDSPVMVQLGHVGERSRSLGSLVRALYRDAFPNLQEPAGGAAVPEPPAQNVFGQKVYGCVLLKTYKAFLSNAAREFRSLKGKMCRDSRIVESS
ncbi:IL-6 subfamily cytokine M17 [Syngnathoides biaculeatus]|uniref:IL-6 subfamily cytokine M17 n=1 Tax=Syngnathoides biaculeatus TaxID=300417 RepID=UPI002ADD6E3C|nr:IL-6 subfamily cytokine M17 [Syngnathoides biaculeatus]